jgi:phosphoglycolate phosphatase
MNQIPFQIIGFDLDGTLLDTSGDLAAATNHALASIGRAPLLHEDVRPMIGGGARAMLKRGLEASGGSDSALLEQLVPELIGYYQAHIDHHTQLFPGALDTLDALAEQGINLGVVTNKTEHLARQLLAEIGLIERFSCIIGGDTMGAGKAKPSPAPIHEMITRCGGGNAAFVGDSRFDVEAARNAGIPSIACSFGFLDGPVEALGADRIIHHYDELIPVLRTF